MTSKHELTGSLLIVDDDHAHRCLIKRRLSQIADKYSIIETSGISEASALLFDKEKPCIPICVILDLNLKDGLGTKLLQRIRRQDYLKNTKVVILSTSSLETDKESCLLHGADYFIVKDEAMQNLDWLVSALDRNQ